ncbi:MAG: hypothetical protein M1833_007277 [Piccolia ochrophora]|nr:MAG: hypothetical protein M1833_007277 [Piccolia ochrophora]
MGGIGLQQLFIVIFLVLVVSFQRRMTSIASSNRIAVKSGWRSLTWTLYVVLALITVRIIFRLVEYADGVDHSNPLPNVEAYIYCLDALPMILAIALLNIVHAGRILVGPDSVFPKLSRAEKKAKRQEKKNKKMQRKEDKRAENLNGSNDSFAQSPEREGDAYQMA